MQITPSGGGGGGGGGGNWKAAAASCCSKTLGMAIPGVLEDGLDAIPVVPLACGPPVMPLGDFFSSESSAITLSAFSPPESPWIVRVEPEEVEEASFSAG